MLVGIGAIFVFILFNAAYLTYAERKIIGHMQVRLGPMRTGWHGILQPIADGLKLFFKEDIIPTQADKPVFILAPFMALIPAFAGFVVVPFGPEVTLFGKTFPLYVTDLNIGVLYILALSSVGVYGILMAGWASNSKYSLLGGLRSAAQLISYEMAMGLAIVAVILWSGSLSLVSIVKAQESFWYILVQPVAFFIFLVAMMAETNRAPFDLPEAETELVSGFHTEYSGMRFAYFFMAEYANMVIVSIMATVLFLGGWNAPFGFLDFIPPIIWFLAKVYFLLFIFIWVRATLPRYRFDQLMHLGWKVFLPLGLVNVVVTALIVLWAK
ncbi:MAG: NADH-quinone oxidoreductase subunit NuoH [Nitrospirae bacterium]|nr:NADH-quinone oxidoreductase subunit NuoH [Nitrospirota bacterium]